MSSRVKDLFLIASSEAGDIPSFTDDVELSGLVVECADLMRGRARSMGHVFEINSHGSLHAQGNEQLLREAYLELIENAVKYGTPGEPIKLGAYLKDSGFCLEVSNEQGHVVTPAADSYGLGLSIVDWIANVHEGKFVTREGHGRVSQALCWAGGGKFGFDNTPQPAPEPALPG